MAPSRMQRPRRETKGEGVLRALNEYCQGLQPGDFVPPHQELAQVFGASERAVRWALDELNRQGKIVRRQGARTFVADPTHGRSAVQVATGSNSAVAAETRTVIAIAIPDRALFDQAMQLLVEQAKTEDLSVFCHLVPKSGVDQAHLSLPQLPQSPLGFILFRRDLEPLTERLQAEGHRVVLLATPYAHAVSSVPTVYGNHKYGAYLATRHLIDLGHRRIASCAYTDWPRTLRGQGHQRALREASKRGINIQDGFIDLNLLKSDPAYAEKVFRGPQAPTGLTVWNDHEAVGILGHLTRLGIRVPQDMSIVGYDNLPEGQAVHPSLTTVYSSMEQQLDAALDLLTSPAPPPSAYQLVVQPTLIPRASTAPVSPEV